MTGLPTPDKLQPTGPETPKPKGPEIKPVEKPLGPREQGIVQRIDQDGNPDKVFADIADGNNKQTGEPVLTGQFEEAQPGSGHPIVGGEIISPTAVRVDDPRNPDGSVNFRASQERGYLSAITGAYGKKDLAEAERQRNVQDIVDAAIKFGIPREQIGAHLQSLGINTVAREQPGNTVNTSRAETGTLPEPPYEQLARQIPIDLNKPIRPEELFPPVGGNMFGDSDTPTLAGKAIGRVYDSLVKRPDFQKTFTPQEIIERGKQARQDYIDYIASTNKQREAAGLQPIGTGSAHKSGADSFHFDGKGGTVTTDHLFYFNKSHTNWKNQGAQEIRGYITLGQNDIGQIQRQFVDLASKMYDEGIDFTAKAASPLGASERTDDMIFYISQQDQPKAAEIMKKFMTERGIGQGHVAAAIPSPQEGLSWAMEPTQTQKQIWQEVSGSTQDGSFNAFVATMAMPTYLERLAEAQVKVGNTQAANTFRQEVQRVKAVIAKHQPQAA